MNALKKQKPANKKLVTRSKKPLDGRANAKLIGKILVGAALKTKSLKTPTVRPKPMAIAKKTTTVKKKPIGTHPTKSTPKTSKISKSPAKSHPSPKKSTAKIQSSKASKTPVIQKTSTKARGKPAKSELAAKPAMKTFNSKSPVIKSPVASMSPVATKGAAPKGKAVELKGLKVGNKFKSAIAKKTAVDAKTNAPKASMVSKASPPTLTKPVTATSHPEPAPAPSNTKPEIVAKIRIAQAEKELRKDLAQSAPKTSLTPLSPVPQIAKGKDRLVLMVRDPYWIHAHWDIMRHSVDRAKAALAEKWHTAKPILRLLKLDDSGTTNNAEVIYRDIEIHGGVRNWYIDVDSPPSRFKMLMGYLCANSRFYELARSNTVLTPALGGKEATDDHWADVATDAEHIYSMSGGYGDDTQTGDLTEVFEERLKRTMDADVLSQFGSGAEGSLKRHKQFHFDVNAELVVFGSTHPEAHVSVGTEPVKVRSDGSFSIRMPLPDRRQVLPATAKSRDGVDSQTVVIAVERNTKVMEPVTSDVDD